MTHVSIESVLTRAAFVFAWFCMRMPTQPALTTGTTTDPWSSGSTVGIFQVRDSDGFDLKGMGLCLSLCMHNMHNMLRACLLTAQSLYSRLREHIHQRIPYVCPSRACLVWTNPSAYSLRLSVPSRLHARLLSCLLLCFSARGFVPRCLRFCWLSPLLFLPGPFFSFVFCCIDCAWSVYASVISAMRLKLRIYR